MAKTWNELTAEEKIEDLRRDVLRIFGALRDQDDRIAFIGQNLGRVEKMVLGVAKRLDEIDPKAMHNGI